MTDGTLPLSRRNLAALDGIRGLAILGVMWFHLGVPAPGGGPIHEVLRSVATHGWAGVDLFFVLSGFLITGILVDTRDSTNYFSSFYLRRALRIFPLYYTFLLLAWLVFPAIVRSDWMPARADWWLYPSYLVNWLVLSKDSWHANIVGHFWSLAVEEQFYLVWPLVVFLLRPRWLLPAVACGELVVMLVRMGWLAQHGVSAALYFATITRMDGLLFGAGCAVVVRRFRLPRWAVAAMPWVSVLCLAVFVGLAGLANPEADVRIAESGGFALLAMGFAAIVLYAVLTDSEHSRLQTWLRWKPLARVGKYAYGIYVFHVPIFYFLREAVRLLPAATQAAAWIRYPVIGLKLYLSFAIASLSYNYFEKRFLALKGRFEPQYRSAAAAASASVG